MRSTLARLARSTGRNLATVVMTSIVAGTLSAVVVSTMVPQSVREVSVPAPVDDSMLWSSWSVVDPAPTAEDQAHCGTWVPAMLFTRAGGVTTSQAICDPNGDASTVNGDVMAGLVGR